MPSLLGRCFHRPPFLVHALYVFVADLPAAFNDPGHQGSDKRGGPGVDADTQGQFESLAIGRFDAPRPESPLDGEGGQEGTSRVVFMSQRRAEKRHKAIAQEMTHRAVVAMHLRTSEIELRVQQAVHRLGAEAFGQRGGAHDVAEPHRNLFQFAGQRALRGEDLLCEVLWRIGLRRCKLRLREYVEWCRALAAKLIFRRVACST